MILRTLKTLIFANSCSRFAVLSIFRRRHRTLFRNIQFYHQNSLLFGGGVHEHQTETLHKLHCSYLRLCFYMVLRMLKTWFSETVDAVLLFSHNSVVGVERFFGIVTFTCRIPCFSIAVFMETKRKRCTGCSDPTCGCVSVVWKPSSPHWNP